MKDFPVLANTTDTFKHDPQGTKKGLPIRSPVDVDGRGRTDFFSNMGEDPDTNETALADFKAGFSTAASLRVFGCDVQDSLEVDPVNADAAPIRPSVTLIQWASRNPVPRASARPKHTPYAVLDHFRVSGRRADRGGRVGCRFGVEQCRFQLKIDPQKIVAAATATAAVNLGAGDGVHSPHRR